MKRKIFLIFLLCKIFGTILGDDIIGNEDSTKKYSKNSVNGDKVHRESNENHVLLAPEIIKNYGYPMEIHDVITEDGYIVTAHRIPVGKKKRKPSRKLRPVVIFGHGMGCNSGCWLRGREKSLPFFLADEGYDVWLTNRRGNDFSYKHVTLNSSDPHFWDFGMHEMACYDLPAFIDYALNLTNQKRLYFLGHSQGTTLGYILLSTRPEYNKKIVLMISLAPVAYIRHAKGPLVRLFTDVIHKNLVQRILIAKKVIQRSQLKIFHSNTTFLQFCRKNNLTENICYQYMYFLNGWDYVPISDEQFDDYFSIFPGNSSDIEVLHYLQIAETDVFAQYDYGKMGNLKRYRSLNPPVYNLEKISTPLAFLYAENDFFVSLHDFLHLVLQLKSCISVYKVPEKTFNHIHFLWGKADEIFYKHILKLMKDFSPKLNFSFNSFPKYDCVKKILGNVLEVN